MAESARPSTDLLCDVGVVVIGRNEGARLVGCLESIPEGARATVYVDSGSSDSSVAEAERRGVHVLHLDTSTPFSAARARNAGFDHLLSLHADLAAVHFVDGDCEFAEGWMGDAVRALERDATVVAVCGFRRERHPERSPYNAICDVEWRFSPAGETSWFGGDVLLRTDAFLEVGGFDPSVIAGEEPELGVRLRRRGGRFLRLDRVSTWHDADMTKASEWWQRARRCGHAYAQVGEMHADPPERYFADERRSAVQWGVAVPVIATALAVPTRGRSFAILAAYPLQVLRIYRATRRRGFDARESRFWAVSCSLSKFAHAAGIFKYQFDRLASRRPTLIEYK